MECAAQSELLRRAQSSSRRVPLVCLAARTSLPSATSSSSSLRCPPASSPHHPLPRPVSDRAPSCSNHRFNHRPPSIFKPSKPPRCSTMSSRYELLVQALDAVMSPGTRQTIFKYLQDLAAQRPFFAVLKSQIITNQQSLIISTVVPCSRSSLRGAGLAGPDFGCDPHRLLDCLLGWSSS